jgi:hypothetical protein
MSTSIWTCVTSFVMREELVVIRLHRAFVRDDLDQSRDHVAFQVLTDV